MVYSFYLHNFANVFRHYEYMKGCIYGTTVPVQSKYIPELVDLRYFYDEYDPKRGKSGEFVGHYLCGIFRDAVRGVLLQNRLQFHDMDFLHSLPQYISNPSVAGFMIEQAVLASIVLHGLHIVPKHQGPITAIFFENKFPSFDTTRDEPALYIPKAFNFRHIDGIIVQIENTKDEKRKLFMFPLQITLRLDNHSDSRKGFFSEWTGWCENLNKFDVVPEFVWISEKVATTKDHDESDEWPAHVERFLSIRQVNMEIWESYEKLKRREHVQDEDPRRTRRVGGTRRAGGTNGITRI